MAGKPDIARKRFQRMTKPAFDESVITFLTDIKFIIENT